MVFVRDFSITCSSHASTSRGVYLALYGSMISSGLSRVLTIFWWFYNRFSVFSFFNVSSEDHLGSVLNSVTKRVFHNLLSIWYWLYIKNTRDLRYFSKIILIQVCSLKSVTQRISRLQGHPIRADKSPTWNDLVIRL